MLICEGDPAIRALLAALLRRAGFATTCGELEAAGAFDAIVCALEDTGVGEAAPGVLRRTIVITTAPLQRVSVRGAFAVFRKPFDVDALVDAVRACTRSAGPAPVDVRSLRRFVASAPLLKRVLSAPASTPRELMLRTSMRKTMTELAKILHEAAGRERNRARADVIVAAMLVADELAGARRAAPRTHGGH